MKMNEIYEAPALEVLNVSVEAGFAGSSGSNVEVEEPDGGVL